MVNQEDFAFILTDLDYKIKERDKSPTIRLFGKTKNEKVMVLINDFFPYFYITEKKGLETFIENNRLISNWKVKLERVKKKRYFGGEEVKLIKIYGTHPEETPKIREQFENAGYEVHEADIPFVKRFLLDTKIKGLNTIIVKPLQIQSEKKSITLLTNSQQIKTDVNEPFISPEYFYKLKILAFDIEVDYQNETIQQLLIEKRNRITAISFVYGTNQFEKNNQLFTLEEDSDQAEKKLINNFINEISQIQPDILITFNGDNFDLPYLLARMEKLNIASKLIALFQDDEIFYSSKMRCYRIKGRISYDISPRTWGIHPITGKKGLGDIAVAVLGKGKIEINKTLGELWKSGFLHGQKEDKKLFEEYALTDSILTYELFWKLGLQGWLEIIRLTGYPPGEAPGSTERIQGEFELMRFAGIQNVLIPQAPDEKEVIRRRIDRRKNPHLGGTVLIPKGTLHLCVLISDFKSMYPSICVAHNIGGETLKHIREVENSNPLTLFHQHPQSCLSLLEETLIKRREEVKAVIKNIDQKLKTILDENEKQKLTEDKEILEKEQYSMKIVANSLLGAHNYIKSRFYSATLGNAITNIARTYILRMEKLLVDISEKITPCEIIYGDTDSAFIKILDESLVINIYNENDLNKKNEKINYLLNICSEILKGLNAFFPKAMDLVLEDIAYKLIFKPGRAKAYSYYSVLNNKLKIIGFEAVRSDWSQFSRNAQKKVLELILKEPVSDIKIEDSGIRKAREYLINLGLEILKTPAEKLIPKVIVLSPIKKDPESYKAKIPVIQAFLHYAKQEKIDPKMSWKEYDKFQWIITSGKGLISDRARHPKYAKDLDRDYYITEILRSSEGFGVKVSLQEIKNMFSMKPIDEILKESNVKIKDSSEKITNENNIPKKKAFTKQTKLSKFFQGKK